MAQETGNNGDEEMQGQCLYLLKWFMSFLGGGLLFWK